MTKIDKLHIMIVITNKNVIINIVSNFKLRRN